VKYLFWISLSCVLYAYAGYPIVMWLLARLRPKNCAVAQMTPSVSIVLAVHNGLALLPRKIEHLFGLDYPNITEIIIVSDGSNDGTAEYLDRLRMPRLKTICLKERSGKAAAVNVGIAEANAEVILFVDIRPEIATGAVQKLMNQFADATVGCVAGELILLEDGHDAVSGAVGGLYWRYEQWIRKCEAVFDSPVGVYGGFYAMRRSLVAPLPSGLILDDMFQPLSVIRQGYRSVICAGAYVYDRWPKKVTGEFSRKVRTLAGNYQLIKLAPWTLTTQNRVLFQLVSHKLMRLVIPYFLVGMMVASISLSRVSYFFTACSCIQLLGLALAIAGLRFRIPVLGRIAAPAGALLVLNVAAVVGLYRFISTRGPLWGIWNTNAPQVNDSIQALQALTSQEALLHVASPALGRHDN